MDAPDIRVRIDKWLWAARFFKTRSLAAQAVEGGKVKSNGERIKPARALRIGERLEIHIGAYEWHIVVRALSERRGPAAIARELYVEEQTSRERREAAVAARRDGIDPTPVHAGRPNKRQRRSLQRLRGY